MTGEYVGADGRIYRWRKVCDEGYMLGLGENEVAYPMILPADWPAAKQALDALIEEEAVEWMLINEPVGLYEGQRRIRKDGSQPQTKAKGLHSNWEDLKTSAYWVDAYRAGLKVGKEQGRKLANLVIGCIEPDACMMTKKGREDALSLARDLLEAGGMILYKLTDSNDKTQNNTQWGENVTHTASGKGDLCSKGWLHAYTDPFLAVLLNPIHANFDPEKMHLWECEGEVGKTDHGLKVGCTSLTTIQRIPIPEVTTEQRVKFAILCALKTADYWQASQSWRDWATNWLAGTDRSAAAETAWAAARAARAAETAETAWAARAAARAAEAAAEAAARAAVVAGAAAEAAARAAVVAGAADIDLIAIAREVCGE